jgi:hypothetical protein
MASLAYHAMTGQDALPEPRDALAPEYLSEVRAYQAQRASLQEVSKAFTKDGEDFRSALIAVAKSPWFRAYNSAPLNETQAAELKHLGTARFESPEGLSRKMTALFGKDYFPEIQELYGAMYGGFSSQPGSVRATETHAVSQGVSERLALSVACRAVSVDFERPAEQRFLFPQVNLDDTDPGKIRENAQYLHQHLLGEGLGVDDPEIVATAALFDATRLTAAGEESALGICAGNVVTSDTGGIVRGWMAVVAYLIMDYRFIFD